MRLRVRVRPRRLLQGVGVLLIAGAGAYGVLGTGLVAVEQVSVQGAATVPAAEVQARAAVPVGTSLALLDVDAVERRVLADPRIQAVDVRRRLPDGVVLAVTERRPVAVVARQGAPDALVAPDGVVIGDAVPADEESDGEGEGEGQDDADSTESSGSEASETPEEASLPRLDVEEPGPDDPATRDALAVLAALPADVLTRLQSVSVQADGVHLAVEDGPEVTWGAPEPLARKAQVVAALLPQAEEELDVRSPDVAVAR